MDAYMHTYTYIHNIHTYTYKHTSMGAYMHTYMHLCVSAYVCFHVHVYVCMYVFVRPGKMNRSTNWLSQGWSTSWSTSWSNKVQSWSTNWLSQGLINELIKPWGRTTSCSSLASKVGHWTWSSCWSTLGLINSLINLSVVGFFEYMIWSSQGWLILFWLNQGHRQHVFSVKSEFGRGVWERSLHACMHACKQTN